MGLIKFFTVLSWGSLFILIWLIALGVLERGDDVAMAAFFFMIAGIFCSAYYPTEPIQSPEEAIDILKKKRPQ